MATEFLMPKLGLTMEEGTIAEWLVADGDTVAAGAAVLRIETDKTETDVEAADAGRLHVVGQVGDTFACGERIGWFLADGEEAPDAPAAAPAAAAAAPAAPAAPAAAAVATAVAATTASGRIIASPMAKRLAAERGLNLATIQGTGPGGRITSEDLEGVTAATQAPVPAASTVAPGTHVPATAAARQLADLLGVEISAVSIEPTDGRVTRETVAQYVRAMLDDRTGPAPVTAAKPAAVATPAAAPAALPPALQTPTTTIRLSGMRGTIAKRMHESLQTMAQLTLQMDADMDAVWADRATRKAADDGRTIPSFTDYVIAASARALLQHPLANSQITDDGVALLPVAHVGMAVALDDGLIVPVIQDTNTLDLSALGDESTRLAGAARSGSLALTDLEGGTFSVSTLGMYGVDGFTPVINPPNTAILGVGRIRDELALIDGEVTSTKKMTLSLTWDHRAFDGAPAAAFAKTIADLLTDPAALDAPAA
ncbi:MAG: dihydrolipoamide acetyltransferase family protein [Ilumatobacter sp.]